MAKPETPARHHHGDLRNALINAGISLLEEGGIEALTLRGCAARAGVSHAAPAHHFDGLAGLKAAIADEAFDRFAGFMRAAATAEDESPRARLHGICRGYLQFGLQHRALLEIMFGINIADLMREQIDADTTEAYQILRAACAPFVPAGMPREVIEIQVWSLIHGYTLLFVSGRLGCINPKHVEDGPFTQVMALLDRIGDAPSP